MLLQRHRRWQGEPRLHTTTGAHKVAFVATFRPLLCATFQSMGANSVRYVPLSQENSPPVRMFLTVCSPLIPAWHTFPNCACAVRCAKLAVDITPMPKPRTMPPPPLSQQNPLDDGDPSDAESRPGVVGPQMRELLARHGTPPHRQVALVADLLSLGGRTVRRKLDGTTAFTEQELAAVLAHIGFVYQGLDGIKQATGDASDAPFSNGADGPAVAIHAAIEFNGRARDCLVWPSANQRNVPAARSWVLLPTTGGGHVIARTDTVPDGESGLLIERIEIIEPYEYEGTGPRLAVYDDSDGGAELVAGALYRAGFRAFPISTVETLSASFNAEHFDAFLLTWTSDSRWAPLDLGSMIRNEFPHATIVFCAGFEDGDAPILVQAADALNAALVTQPVPTAIIARTILRDMKAQTARSRKRL